jgi:hypothetical protein
LGKSSTHESRAEAEARLVLEVSAGWVSSSSRGLRSGDSPPAHLQTQPRRGEGGTCLAARRGHVRRRQWCEQRLHQLHLSLLSLSGGPRGEGRGALALPRAVATSAAASGVSSGSTSCTARSTASHFSAAISTCSASSAASNAAACETRRHALSSERLALRMVFRPTGCAHLLRLGGHARVNRCALAAESQPHTQRRLQAARRRTAWPQHLWVGLTYTWVG